MEFDGLISLLPDDNPEGADKVEDTPKAATKATPINIGKGKDNPKKATPNKKPPNSSTESSGNDDSSGSREDDDSMDHDDGCHRLQRAPLPFSAKKVDYVFVGPNLRCAVPRTTAIPHWVRSRRSGAPTDPQDKADGPDSVQQCQHTSSPNEHRQECQPSPLTRHDEDALSTPHQQPSPPNPVSPPHSPERSTISTGDTGMQVDSAADPDGDIQSSGTPQCSLIISNSVEEGSKALLKEHHLISPPNDRGQECQPKPLVAPHDEDAQECLSMPHQHAHQLSPQDLIPSDADM
ncbi:hypothetical protein BKA82DRAFT_32466 [Pisolithus tinctorius]|uniref:Uncharacterized protein n=1 Tax=Pisolithus tinctorius Marx 270 TaxID=870435 RepID=A0A0C3N878_PISTI|nr:hypothetical protein BKA82DRAFT_32466 [Pisolithus tinctorius]KIN97244.1 hypothetical protein M404DRAFT_32466 [Pisolithus tinctorius Marx 270]